MVHDPLKEERRQLAKIKRERKFRLWICTLSWTTPIMAFGAFFTLWRDLSVPNNQDLYSIGSEGQNVSTIQEDLAQLGYFHHDTTQYYGPITQAAVMAFQKSNHLPPTGLVDTLTLTHIEQAVEGSRNSSAVKVLSPAAPTQHANSGNVSMNTQSDAAPITITSAS